MMKNPFHPDMTEYEAGRLFVTEVLNTPKGEEREQFIQFYLEAQSLILKKTLDRNEHLPPDALIVS